MVRLVENDAPVPRALTGEEVLRLVGALIGEHLPNVPPTDPYWAVLTSLHGTATWDCRR